MKDLCACLRVYCATPKTMHIVWHWRVCTKNTRNVPSYGDGAAGTRKMYFRLEMELRRLCRHGRNDECRGVCLVASGVLQPGAPSKTISLLFLSVFAAAVTVSSTRPWLAVWPVRDDNPTVDQTYKSLADRHVNGGLKTATPHYVVREFDIRSYLAFAVTTGIQPSADNRNFGAVKYFTSQHVTVS